MNKIFKKIFICIAMSSALIATSCEKEPAQVIEYLDVNAHNISGNWKLDKWNDAPLAEGTEMYIKFNRNDQTYEMWQNMDSFADIPHYVTGEFNIVSDPETGSLLYGKYDYDQGGWQYTYIVKELTDNSMMWVAKEDPTFIQHFIRVAEIPYDTEKEEL